MRQKTSIRDSHSDRIINGFILVVSILMVLICAYPLYYMVVASFSSLSDIATGDAWLYPKHPTIFGYNYLLSYSRLWKGYLNTIFYTALGTSLNLALTIPAGYVLSRKNYVLAKPVLVFYTITMFVNGGLMPTYNLIAKLNMLDSVWALVMPGAVSVFYLLVVRTFFRTSLPEEMYEAAQLDGCGNYRYFLTMVLPNSAAILAVIGLYCAVGHWNNYFSALIYLRDSAKSPLQLVLREILILTTGDVAAGSDLNTADKRQLSNLVKYGAIVLSTLPLMLAYPFLQRYFMQGVMIGSLKG